jgi:hypothetical protein
MADKKTTTDTIMVALAWLAAAALVYLVIIKMRLFFHK